MKTLNKQFDDQLNEIYADDKQREILMRFLSDYCRNEELIDYVMEKLGDGSYKKGDDARAFFCRCADELFFKRLDAVKGKKEPNMLRKFHPLFGASWWTR